MSLQKEPSVAAKKHLLSAEKAAYKAYDSRVEEMKHSGQGVLPHNGNNQKMIVSSIISLLADHDKKRFSREMEIIREKAALDPVHYSPLAYALSVAEGSLIKQGPIRARAGRCL